MIASLPKDETIGVFRPLDHLRDLPRMTDRDKRRFWRAVDRRGPEDCWPWMKCTTAKGYGMFRLQRRNYYAHRLAFVLGGKQFDRGPLIRHIKCHNARCCNPAHLGCGTLLDNVEDAVRDGTVSKGEDHFAAKLTDHAVREIRRLHIGGFTGRRLSLLFGVAEGNISMVVHRKAWKHVH